MRPEGWEHSREAKDKIAIAMRNAAAKRAAVKAQLNYYAVKSFKVHIAREGKKTTMCGNHRPQDWPRATAETVDCKFCLAALPFGATVCYLEST